MIIEIPDLTGAECADIAITAAEGGIGHWSVILVYDHERWGSGDETPPVEVANDFVFYTIEFENPESDDPPRKTFDVTPQTFRTGLELMSQAPLDRGGWPVPRLLAIGRDDWTGEIDSEIADMLVQFGVFGEVVFG